MANATYAQLCAQPLPQGDVVALVAALDRRAAALAVEHALRVKEQIQRQIEVVTRAAEAVGRYEVYNRQDHLAGRFADQLAAAQDELAREQAYLLKLISTFAHVDADYEA